MSTLEPMCGDSDNGAHCETCGHCIATESVRWCMDHNPAWATFREREVAP